MSAKGAVQVSSIQRENQRQMYTVTVDLAEGPSAMQVTRQVNQLLSQIPIPDVYGVTWGMRQEFDDSLGNLLLTLVEHINQLRERGSVIS